jgi:hypothetical protein
MADAQCRHCHFLGWPEASGTSWEPIRWECSLGKTYSDQPQACRWYERECGADDDLGAPNTQPAVMTHPGKDLG